VGAYTASNADGPLRQCEVLENVIEARIIVESLRLNLGEFEVEERIHPLGIVLTQDCDLTWDYNARTTGDPQQGHKLLPNVLLCELWEADRLRGTQAISTNPWKRIRQNQDERYHYLSECGAEDDLAGTGLVVLAIDFKRVFTVPTDELYFRISAGQVRHRCCLNGAFLQDLSNRFGYYQMRVALPDIPQAAIALPAVPVCD
jgi:hypothetical protein